MDRKVHSFCFIFPYQHFNCSSQISRSKCEVKQTDNQRDYAKSGSSRLSVSLQEHTHTSHFWKAMFSLNHDSFFTLECKKKSVLMTVFWTFMMLQESFKHLNMLHLFEMNKRTCSVHWLLQQGVVSGNMSGLPFLCKETVVLPWKPNSLLFSKTILRYY